MLVATLMVSSGSFTREGSIAYPFIMLKRRTIFSPAFFCSQLSCNILLEPDGDDQTPWSTDARKFRRFFDFIMYTLDYHRVSMRIRKPAGSMYSHHMEG